MLHQQFVDIALGTKSLTRTLFFFYILLKITYMNSRNLSLCYPSSPMGGSTTIVQTLQELRKLPATSYLESHV